MMVTCGCLFKAVRIWSGTLENRHFATGWGDISREDKQSMDRNVFSHATQELFCAATDALQMELHGKRSLCHGYARAPLGEPTVRARLQR